MFQVKDALSILAGMINHVRATTRKITDFTIGSVIRTLLEAVAGEVDQLYQQMLHGLLEAIPIAVYNGFGFDTLPAVAASGLVRFTLSPPSVTALDIPQGTIVATAAGLQYVTTVAGTIPAGETTIDIPVTAVQAGSAGNVLPGEIDQLISLVHSGLSVSNPAAFTNGRGAETAEERQLRFADYIRSMTRGTVSSLQYAARSAVILDEVSGLVLERVARVAVDETAGSVVLYIHNGVGATSAALVAEVSRIIEGSRDLATGTYTPGYRPAGMRVDVLAMVEQPVNVAFLVQAAETTRPADLEGRIAAAVSTVIRAAVSGGTGLRPIDLVNAVLGQPGVSAAQILAPTVLVPCGLGQVLVPGTLSLTWGTTTVGTGG